MVNIYLVYIFKLVIVVQLWISFRVQLCDSSTKWYSLRFSCVREIRLPLSYMIAPKKMVVHMVYFMIA